MRQPVPPPAGSGLSSPFDVVSPPPSRAEALEATWRAYYQQAREAPRHPAARDFLHQALQTALARLIPADASVLEVGCGEGDLLAALPNARRAGLDYLPETIERARARHPEIAFEVGRLWRLNAMRIGTGNPDLIFPGQELRLK